jgi:hypothetical protein
MYLIIPPVFLAPLVSLYYSAYLVVNLGSVIPIWLLNQVYEDACIDDGFPSFGRNTNLKIPKVSLHHELS